MGQIIHPLEPQQLLQKEGTELARQPRTSGLGCHACDQPQEEALPARSPPHKLHQSDAAFKRKWLQNGSILQQSAARMVGVGDDDGEPHKKLSGSGSRACCGVPRSGGNGYGEE